MGCRQATGAWRWWTRASREELLDALGTGGGAAHRADQLTVLASRDVYMTDRGFDMDGMLTYGPSCGASPRAGPATTASARPGR